MLQNIRRIIYQDVKNENETKKVSVILRLNAITMFIYFLCLLCVFCVTGAWWLAVWCVPCLCAYMAAFYTTYLNKTKLAVIVSFVVMVCWVVGFIWEIGWDCGVQHFSFVMVVLWFTVYHGSAVWKTLMAVAACTLRLLLYAYTNVYEPRYVLEPEISVTFQVINTIFIFMVISVIMAVFAKDSQEMEQKLVQYNKKLHKQASVDPLTGLMNRRGTNEYLEKVLTDYEKGKIVNLCLAIGDIDFFKRVNDTYGHECGDLVLQNIAALFKENVGEWGLVSRWGGEEFLFIFENVNGDDALMILEDLRRKIKKMEIQYKDETIRVTMTFGLSDFDFRKDVEHSINDVDEKLYQGKNMGRDQIVY